MANKLANTVTIAGAPELLIDMGDGTFARQFVTAKAFYQLLSGGAAIGAGPNVGPVVGGDYAWRVEATAWNSATAALKYLGLDGTTWFPVLKADGVTAVTLTANGVVSMGIAQGAIVRIEVTGAAPTGMNSALGGL